MIRININSRAPLLSATFKWQVSDIMRKLEKRGAAVSTWASRIVSKQKLVIASCLTRIATSILRGFLMAILSLFWSVPTIFEVEATLGPSNWGPSPLQVGYEVSYVFGILAGNPENNFVPNSPMHPSRCYTAKWVIEGPKVQLEGQNEGNVKLTVSALLSPNNKIMKHVLFICHRILKLSSFSSRKNAPAFWVWWWTGFSLFPREAYLPLLCWVIKWHWHNWWLLSDTG